MKDLLKEQVKLKKNTRRIPLTMSSNNINETTSLMDLSRIKEELYTFALPEEREGIENAAEIYSRFPKLGEEILRDLHKNRKSKYPEKKKQLLTEQKEKRWKEEQRSLTPQPWLHSSHYSENYRELQNILGYSMIDDCANGCHNKTYRFSKDVMPIIHKAVIHYRESVMQKHVFEYTKFPEKGNVEEDVEEPNVEDEGVWEEAETITVDGVEYQHDKDTHEMMRCSDFEGVGKWNPDLKEIDFYDDDEDDDE